MKRWLLIAAGFFVLAAGFGSFYKTKALSGGDPDRYYHIALSRLAVETGRPFLRSVPQVEDLGWGDYFVDKEFLFHEATNLGYWIAGEKGVIEASFLCAILSILVFYLFAAGRIPLPAAFVITVLTFSSPYLAFRMPLLRPHTLAVLAFLLMTVCVMYRKPKLTAFSAMLFVLSYHAFYVPMLGMAWLFALSYLDDIESARLWRRVSSYGFFGCVAGLLANPYFPGNIVIAMIHMRIPELMKGELKNAPFGNELVPIRADEHFQVFSGTLLVLFVCVLLLGIDLGRREEGQKSARVRLLYLLGGGAFFLAISFQIARAGEYLVPLCGLILVLLVERWRRYVRPATLVLAVLALAQVAFVRNAYRQKYGDMTDEDRVRQTFLAIKAIPAEAKGAKVFNCEWDRTPYIFYARPDLRFVDILDPSLLYFAKRGAYHAVEDLRAGTIPDAYGLIHDGFKADFVFCGDQSVSEELRNEPGFQQIYPRVQSVGQSPMIPSVFRVLPKSASEFVRTLSFTEPENVDNEKLARIKPPPSSVPRREFEMDKTPYANLSAFKKPVFEGSEAHCTFVSPSQDEVKRLAGADFLGVGGGPGFKAWRNGKPLFSTRGGFPTLRSIQVLLPLDPPLRANDRLETLVCILDGQKFWGTELSLWTRKDIQETCAEKRNELSKPASNPSDWPYVGLQLLTCLGPVAAPEQGRFLSAPERTPPVRHKGVN